MRRWLLVPVAVVAGGSLALAGVWVGNRVWPQTSASTVASLRDPTIVGSGASADPSAPAAGGAVALAEPSPVHGLDGGGWMLPVDLVGPATGAAAGGDTTAPTSAAPSGPASPSAGAAVPADQAVATAELVGTAQLDSAAAARRFVDGCAAGATPCPLGVGADVVPFDLPASPPLTVRIWPGTTRAVDPALRCDPGYRTSEVLPVVVTADLPLDELTVTLSIVGGPTLDTASQHGPVQSEQNWFQVHVGPQGAVGTDLGSGLQYCAALRTEADPSVAQGLKGTTLPAPTIYRVRVEGGVAGGPSTTQEIDLPLEQVGSRPPLTLSPLSGNVIQYTVPELDPARHARPVVWATETPELWDHASDLCATRPRPEYTDAETWQGVLSVPQPYDSAELARADYPYDRAWSHFAVGNLVLPESASALFCVMWPETAGTEYQGVALQAPDGLTFELELSSFQASDDALRTWSDFTVVDRDAGCYSPALHTGPMSTTPVCDSKGLAWPWFTNLHAIAMDHAGREVDMGTTRIASFTWCTPTPDQVGSPLAVMILVDAAASGCRGQEWDVTVTWADAVLCNDTFGGSCDDHVHARATGRARLVDYGGNGRRSQLDWVIRHDAPTVVLPVVNAPPTH